MKAIKEITRIVSKALGGIAALTFLLAPLTSGGFLLMAASAVVCFICMGGYMWSEPDVDPQSDEDLN